MHTDRIHLVDYLRSTYIKYQKLFMRQKGRQLNLYQRQTKRKHVNNEEFKAEIFEETEALVSSQVKNVSPEMKHQDKGGDTEKRLVKVQMSLSSQSLKMPSFNCQI